MGCVNRKVLCVVVVMVMAAWWWRCWWQVDPVLSPGGAAAESIGYLMCAGLTT
jgi:hypothetical protein